MSGSRFGNGSLKPWRSGYQTATVIGALWTIVAAVTVAVAVSFATGQGLAPSLATALAIGLALGLMALPIESGRAAFQGSLLTALLVVVALLWWLTGPPIQGNADTTWGVLLTAWALLLLSAGWPTWLMVRDLRIGEITRHEFEAAAIKFLTGFGYVFFTAIVLIPFYVMVMTSLKNQAALLANPLDFTIDLSQGWNLFRSYFELFEQFNFGRYLLTSLMSCQCSRS